MNEAASNIGPSFHRPRRDDGTVDEATVAVYERQAATWVERRGAPLDDIGERFRLRVGDGPVLDAGCGPGRYLAQLGPRVVGVDATAALLAAAQECGAAPLVRGDLEALPFASGIFAGVFARHCYLHLQKHRFVPALGDVVRVLQPGGQLLLTMIPGTYEGRRLPGDDFPGRWFSLWEPAELEAALVAAGFVHVRVDRDPTRRPSDLVARATAP